MMQIAYEFDFAQAKLRAFCFHRQVDGCNEATSSGTYHLDEQALPRWALQRFDALAADLMEVAIAAHIADRLSLRKPVGVRSTAGLWWSRRLNLRVGVREPERWNDPQIKDWLYKYLQFNTGDNWQIEFVARTAPVTGSESQGCLDLDEHAAWKRRYLDLRIALFSGGLDSLAGLAHQLNEYPKARFNLISVNSNPLVLKCQERLIDAFPVAERERAHHIPVRLELHSVQLDDGKTQPQEKSLRTRGLIFLTAAGIAAHLAGQREFFVFENGIGALNLPFDRSQMIGQNNRATHPLSLAYFSQFLTALSRRSMRVINPYQFQTKGQLCQALAAPSWSELIALTFTCPYPHRKKQAGIKQCGICTSCILRRQALRVAGLSHKDTQKYVYDPQTVPTRKLNDWIAMYGQKRRIEHALGTGFTAKQDWQQLALEFPELIETVEMLAATQHLAKSDIERSILRLLRAYVKEGLLVTEAPLQLLPSTGQISDTPYIAVA